VVKAARAAVFGALSLSRWRARRSATMPGASVRQSCA
jgi:hypothetical protein